MRMIWMSCYLRRAFSVTICVDANKKLKENPALENSFFFKKLNKTPM